MLMEKFIKFLVVTAVSAFRPRWVINSQLL